MAGTQGSAEIVPQRELLTLVLTEVPARLSVADPGDWLGDLADVQAAMKVPIADDLLFSRATRWGRRLPRPIPAILG
jgi:hypothetical protein